MANTYKEGANVHDPRTPLPAPGSDPVAALRAQIAELRAELRTALARQAEEVTTRRLVVADADGFARVRITAEGDHGHVVVRARTADGEPTQADLFALDAVDADDHPTVGLDLTCRGDPVARFTEPPPPAAR